MKKIILLVGLLIVFVGVQAQDFAISPKSTYKSYIGAAGDTIEGTTSLSKVCNVEKGYIYFYNITMDIDSLGAGDVSCILAGSNDNVNYTTITDITYGATADTVFRYADVSTGVLWRFLKFTMTGDGATSGAELQKFNVKVAAKYTP